MDAPVKKLPKLRRDDLAGGCFGCHMSFLDIDEHLFELVELIEFDRSPLTDIKELGIATSASSRAASATPRTCISCASSGALQKLVALGACAVTAAAGAAQPPQADRNPRRGLSHQPGYREGADPERPELPLPLNKVHPLHEVVKIDWFIPGCPPPARRSGRR